MLFFRSKRISIDLSSAVLQMKKPKENNRQDKDRMNDTKSYCPVNEIINNRGDMVPPTE